jgi:redox-sensitive bicupin YhaK (pirin superfamily)
VGIAVAASITACSRRDEPAAPSASPSGAQSLVRAKNIKWGVAPPGLPAGAKAAVLQGNPGAAGPYVIRLQFPAKYRIPFHSYAKAQDMTVVSGTLFAANTQTFDKKKAFSIRPGDFYHLPAATPQFLFTKDETVIDIHGEGPYEIRYVTAADDPLKGAKAPEYRFPEPVKDSDLSPSEADETIDMTF